MQTSAIPYRVADFLKQHPPFQSMDEADLLMLAQRGRVKFHEPGEYLCWQGSAYLPFLYVIQQGTVSLWEDSAGAEKLSDIRGAGDIVGIERFLATAHGEPPKSPYSAKSESEVVVYALHAADFGKLLDRYSHAAKYVESQACVRADFHSPGQKRAAHQIYLAELVPPGDPVTCDGASSIHEAAVRLSTASSGAVVILDGGQVTGLLTADDLVRAVASPAFDPAAPVASIASPAPAFASPDLLLSAAIVRMAGSSAPALAITAGGTPGSPLQRIATASDLLPAFGDHPLAILQAIPRAPDVAVLRDLLARARAFVLEQLTGPLAVDWLAEFFDQVHTAILVRLIRFSEIPAEACWCFAGAAGRREWMTPAAPLLALITPDEAAAERARVALPAFRDALEVCGFFLPQTPDGDTLASWKARFEQWIANPILSGTYDALPYFDLRAFDGNTALAADLVASARAEVRAQPAFVPLIANDCLVNLPPLTFFQDQVVDDSGQHQDVFHLERNSLQPLVDVARVFGIASGHALEGSTLERFEFARKLLPQQDLLFRQAADTFRVVLEEQARMGIRLGNDGAAVPPEWLSRHDRQVLKSGFRTIQRLLEFTGERQWSKVR